MDTSLNSNLTGEIESNKRNFLDISDLNVENDNEKIDANNTSITSIESTTEKPIVLLNSAKKIKLTKEELILLNDERQKMKAEREILKFEREKVRLEKERVKIEKEKQKIERDAKLQKDREKKIQELQEKKLLDGKEKQDKLRAKENEKIRIREMKEKEKQRRIEEKIALDQEKSKIEEKKLEKSRAVLFNFLKKASPKKDFENANAQEDGVPSNSNGNNVILNNANFDCGKFISQIYKDVPIEGLYLHQLQTGQYKPKLRNNPVTEDQDVMIINDLPDLNSTEFCFFQFCENIRPSYFGVRTNRSTIITGRNPFAKDECLDYNADSDDEWDEGGPGESLSDSEPETEEKDDYEIDNDFFVPHGYLSDDENEINEPIAEDENQGCTGPLYKEQTLIAERNRRFAHSLVPQVIGCIWNENMANFGDKVKFLQRFQRVLLSK